MIIGGLRFLRRCAIIDGLQLVPDIEVYSCLDEGGGKNHLARAGEIEVLLGVEGKIVPVGQIFDTKANRSTLTVRATSAQFVHDRP